MRAPAHTHTFFFFPSLFISRLVNQLKSGPHLDIAPKLFSIEVNNGISVGKHDQLMEWSVCVGVCMCVCEAVCMCLRLWGSVPFCVRIRVYVYVMG